MPAALRRRAHELNHDPDRDVVIGVALSILERDNEDAAVNGERRRLDSMMKLAGQVIAPQHR